MNINVEDASFCATTEAPQAEITQLLQLQHSEEKRTIIVGSIALGHSKLLSREEEVQLFGELNLGRQAQTAKLVCNGLRSFLWYEPTEVPEIEQMIDRAKEARDRIIMSNTRLVYSRARKIERKYQSKDLEFGDLFQEGMFGLFRAIDRFDPSKGFKLATLATDFIDNDIENAIKNKKRNIHIPKGVSDDASRIERKRLTWRQDHGREPTIEEIAEELGMNDSRIESENMVRYRGGTISLSTPRASDGRKSDSTIVDTISDNTQLGVEEQAVESLTNEERKRYLLGLLKITGLKEREIEILGLRFGLGTIGLGTTGEVLNNVEIGKLYNVSRQRIDQIVKKVVKKLRDAAGATTTEEVLEELKTKDKAGVS